MAMTHVIGAGLAGLACAVTLAAAGRRVTVYEGAGQAGGRCRSFHDDTLDCEIDNGNHLMLSGNWGVMRYLETIGARDSLIAPLRAAIPFVDLETGERWTVRPNAGRIPCWIFSAARRVPGSRPAHYLQALRLARAGPKTTVADCFDTSLPLYRRLWEPFAVAVLNTAADEGSARLLWPVITETLAKGEAYTRPCVARDGLSHSLVTPALRYLDEMGSEVRFNRRLRGLETKDDRISGLDFARGGTSLQPDDQVVVAVPTAAAGAILPDIFPPTETRSIVNAHFKLDTPPKPPTAGTPNDTSENTEVPIIGVIGGTAQWVFVRGPIASVTISAAEDVVDEKPETLAPRIWADVAKALELGDMPMPKVRIVKEKRATFAQTPAAVAMRPGTETAYANLYLAGDWTDTGLPATIEGAIRSGFKAAETILSKGVAGGKPGS